MISFGFYALFARDLLETYTQDKRLDHFLQWITKICFGYSILYFIFFDWIIDYRVLLFTCLRIIIFTMSVYGLIWIYRSIHSPSKFYFIVGSSLTYFFGSLIASLLYIGIPLPYNWIGSLTSAAYFELSILLQALFLQWL